MREPTYQTVARLVKKGIDRDTIAAQLGTTRKNVNAHINQARMHDVLPPFKPQARYLVENALKKRGIRMGGMPDVFEALTPEVARWLGRQAVEGMTMAEVVAAFVTDAYFEENE